MKCEEINTMELRRKFASMNIFLAYNKIIIQSHKREKFIAGAGDWLIVKEKCTIS